MADPMQMPRLDAYAQDLLRQSYQQTPISPENLALYGQGMMQQVPAPPQIESYAAPQQMQQQYMQPNADRMNYMRMVEDRFNQIANAVGGMEVLAVTGRIDKARQRAQKDIEMMYGAFKEPVRVIDVEGTKVATGGDLRSPIVLPTETERKAAMTGLEKTQFELEEAKKKLALTEQEAQMKNLDRALKLQTALASSADAVMTIDDLLNNPKLAEGVGWNNIKSIFPESEAKELQTKIDKLKGKTFLQAYESLRGASGISNIEGAKAEQAMQRLDPKMSVDQFKAALRELRGTFVGFSQNAATGLQGYLPQQQGQQANSSQPPMQQTVPQIPAEPAEPMRVQSPGAIPIGRDPVTKKLFIQK